MSTQYLVGISAINETGFDQYTIDEIKFDSFDHALNFIRNYNRNFNTNSAHYVRAEYFGEIDSETGEFV